MCDVGLELLADYPKCSQDLNPIETAWRGLRRRLSVTEPTSMETRAAFGIRLRHAVVWLNKHRVSHFMELCTLQKERARHVRDVQGARTNHLGARAARGGAGRGGLACPYRFPRAQWLLHNGSRAPVVASMIGLRRDLTKIRWIRVSYRILASTALSLRSPTRNATIAPVLVPTIISKASHTSTPSIASTRCRIDVTAAIPRVPPPSRHNTRRPRCPDSLGTHLLCPIAASNLFAFCCT